MEEISYSVRRSERARRVRVTVEPDRGVEVVLTRRAPERAAAAALGTRFARAFWLLGIILWQRRKGGLLVFYGL